MNDLSQGANLTDDQGEPMSDDDVLAEIKEREKEAFGPKRKEWQDEARECYNFAALHQWDDEDLRVLKDQGRPAITFDRISAVLNVVAGLEVSNRQEVRYIPRELGDAAVNELYTSAGQWVRDECNAEDEESEAFSDMTICGEGWTETRLDYEYDPDGAILIERTDPMEMGPDPRARKKNYADMEYLVRKKLVDPDWVKDLWPDKEDDIDGEKQLAKEDDEDLPGHTMRVAGDQYKSPWTSTNPQGQNRQVVLIEYQCKRREPYYRVADPTTGQVAELTPAKFTTLNKRMKQMGLPLQAVKQTRCRFYRAFAVGETLLEYKLCPDPTSFTYKAMTDKRDRNKNRWYGLVKGMLDPQRWTNKWLSQSMHILNTSAKGGVMAEKTAVEKPSEFEASYADSRKVTWVSDGALSQGRIQPKVPPPFPDQLNHLLQFAMEAIHGVSGVSPELLGNADRDQPAQLEYQRKQAGITILASLFDALRKYRKEQGKTLLYMIQTYISDNRLIRIVGQEQAKYVPLTKTPGSSRFDVIIDEAPNSPNQKDKTWLVIKDILIPLILKHGGEIPKEIYPYMPLPVSLTEKLMKPPTPEQEQEAQQVKQLRMRGEAAKVMKDEASAMKDKAQAEATLKGEDQSGEVIKGQLAISEGQAKVKLIEAQIAKILAEIQALGSAPANEIEQAKLILQDKEIELSRQEMLLKDERERLSMGLQHQRETEANQLDAQTKTEIAGQNNDTKEKVSAIGKKLFQSPEDKKAEKDGEEKTRQLILDGFSKIAETMAKPRKVVRGNDGKIAGVE